MTAIPFSLSAVLLAVYAVAFLTGGCLAVLLGNLGLSSLLGLILATFLAVPICGAVRKRIAGLAAQAAGAEGQSPVASSYPVRLVAGAVVAVLVSYGLWTAEFLSYGFLLGGLSALSTMLFLSVIFTLAVARR